MPRDRQPPIARALQEPPSDISSESLKRDIGSVRPSVGIQRHKALYRDQGERLLCGRPSARAAEIINARNTLTRLSVQTSHHTSLDSASEDWKQVMVPGKSRRSKFNDYEVFEIVDLDRVSYRVSKDGGLAVVAQRGVRGALYA